MGSVGADVVIEPVHSDYRFGPLCHSGLMVIGNPSLPEHADCRRGAVSLATLSIVLCELGDYLDVPLWVGQPEVTEPRSTINPSTSMASKPDRWPWF